MGRTSRALAAWVGALFWLSATGQDNETCTTESCGVTTCAAGFELEVALDSDSLVISCNECVEDFFKADEGAESCTACPDGLVASGGATVCNLEAGFWRTSNASLEVYECANADACVGGSDEASYCSDGFKGPLCAVCTDDFYPSGSFECLECSTANAASTIITILLFLAALTLFIVVLVKASEHIEEKSREHDDSANEAANAKAMATGQNSKIFQFVKKWKDTLVVRFKIIVAHFQIVATFPAVLDVQWPESFNRYADKISVISLDFWGILSQGCFFRADFLKQLVFTTLLPLAVVGVLLGNYYRTVTVNSARPEARRAAWDNTAGGVLLTGFFFYIVTSTLILEAFDCQNFDDGSSYLKADYSISCDSQKYSFIYGYAVTMAIIFPAGIPATYLAVLYVGRERINPDPYNPEASLELREGDKTIQKTKFLWGTYRPAVYFYEVWECIRKLLLTGLLVYFEDGTSTQVVIAILITLSGLRVLSGLRPYRREDENNLAEASLWVTFLTLFAGLLIKSQVAEEDGYDTVALGVILSIMNAALVGLAAFQILWTTTSFMKEKWDENFVEPQTDGDRYKTRPLSAPARRNATNSQRAPLASPTAQERNAMSARGRTNMTYSSSGKTGVKPVEVSPRFRSPVPMDYPVNTRVSAKVTGNRTSSRA